MQKKIRKESAVKTHCWFDMDHTLIRNDCDVSWKYFLVRKGLADAGETERTADRFYQQYLARTLIPEDFMEFQLREFRGRTPGEVALLAREHFETVVRPLIYPDALALVRRLAAQGVPLAIVTSTNEAVARPVADFFGISELFGATPEIADGRYTGRMTGIYPVREGKVKILENYCCKHALKPEQFAYYGDSMSDADILSRVGEPHAVNPGEELARLAAENNWAVESFRLTDGR